MKNNSSLKKGLARRFVTLMGIFFICFIIGAAILLITLNIVNDSYITKRDELRVKQHIAEEINNVFNQGILNARGYIAFGNTSLRDIALAKEPKIESLEKKFATYSSTKEDEQLLSKIKEFRIYYFIETFPQNITDFEAGRKQAIINKANSQSTARVNQFQNSMEEYLQDLDGNLETHYQKLRKIQTFIQVSFVLFILLILLLLLAIIRVMLRQIVQPLSQFANAANEIASGNEAFIHFNVDRDDEIGALSAAFQKMVEKVKEKEQTLRKRNEELNSLVQMKSELVSTVSHELRTPLASILGFTELMLNRELKPERKEKYLTTILNEAKRLTALINDFLDIQKMESGKQSYEKKYIELIPILEKVIEGQQVNTVNHEILLETLITNPIILGDKSKLEQVFTNLINNSIKYSPSGGQVKIVVSQTGNQLKVAIIDSGLGIPEDSISKLFTKFFRIDNSDRRKIGGTGLGLAIVQEIVKAHYGQITVQSEYGKGSVFTTIFPAVEVNQEIDNNEEDLEYASSFKILVVEDDQSLADLISQELRDSGFSVICFKNGIETMDYLQQEIPDAIVLDILLEDNNYDGWQIMREIKEKENLKKIPIIVSTALDEKEKGFALGAMDYLVKPYKPSHLSKAIMQTLLKVGKVGQILIPEKNHRH